VSGIRAFLVLGLLACAVQAAQPVAPAFTPVAHSALVTVEAATTPADLILRLHRSAGAAPLVVTEFAVSIDGRNAAATPRTDGTWSVSWPASAAPPRKLEVVIAHDGIREVLSGELPAAGGSHAAPVAGSLWHDHKQLAWWILNIVVVLIAAIAISRRMA
jgi:hypothetical protein